MSCLQGPQRVLMGFTLALLLSAGGVGLVHAHKNTRALSADHLIACIKTAVAAQAGMVREVEVEYEDARWLCEVKLVDDMGKRHTLYVDVADNQVVRAK